MKNFILVTLIALLILSFNSFFIIHEGERGIVLQFSKVIRDRDTGETLVFEPGIHFKWPFVDNVRRLDARVQTLDDDAGRFVTAEKKDLIVDSFVKWRVTDFATFYLSTGGGIRARAEDLLKQKVNNGLRSEFGNRTIKEIVSGERRELMEEAMIQASEGSGDLGIEIVDVRLKQINLPQEVSESIFNRMRAGRIAVAKEHRSEGREQAEIINANIDARVTVMLADAERKASQVKGEGEGEAAKIYAEAYNRDSEFFSFLRSIDAYKQSFNSKNDVMIINPDSDFFRFLNRADGKAPN